MQADDPAFLPVGTDVSAKYKGAFCEAKIKKVVRNIKCKVTFKGAGGGSVTVLDDAIKGTLRVGNTVEVKLDQKKEPFEAIITKIQDCSQYTVVFDDGDITTLRRSALCLKSGRHFAESETLDQLPLTHPEHFGNPVIGSSSRRGRRTNRAQSDDSDSEASEWAGGSGGGGNGSGSTVTEREPHAGRVVLVQCSTGDKKRAHHSHQWFPGLVVAPNAQDTVKIKVKDDYLVRSFKDGRYYTVPKKEAREFRRNNASSEWVGVEAAILYLDKGVLPPHWDRDILFGQESLSQSDEVDSEESSDDEPHEEKDHFVAQLYKFMDDRGTPLNRQPTIGNKDIDLYRLFKVVQKLGGYNRVTNQNQWKKISLRLGFVPATPNVTNLCRQAYKKFLHSFEDFYRKLGVTLLSQSKSGRTTGRSLIRDKDKMHSNTTPKSASPAPIASEKLEGKSVGKGKDKDLEKETKTKEKDLKKDIDTKDKETKPIPREKDKEKDVKEKEVKEKDVREAKVVEKEKEVKGKDKVKDTKEKETKETKEKAKEKDTVKKQKDAKPKIESINSSEDDSGDNQPLAPLSTLKSESEKQTEKSKAQETPKSKLFKSASGSLDVKKAEKGSGKKIAHRRNSLPRCAPGNKSDSQISVKSEGRCKSSSSDSSTTNKKLFSDIEKGKDKDSSGTPAGKRQASNDKNDSDSSSRGSKNGKTSARRNAAASSDITPPQTPVSVSSQLQANKKPRKRKITDSPDTSQFITADVGDKLKVYYGPTHSESKVTYEAKVIEINGKGPDALLRVHYTGWNTRYDEWIKPSRIADNFTQNPKNKHKDKGKKSTSNNSGPPETVGAKKTRVASASSKPHTRNRSGSNNIINTSQPTTDVSVHSESDSDLESDSSGQTKKTNDDKVTSEKASESSTAEKSTEGPKEKITKTPKSTKTPQTKRTAENPQIRVKRARLKQEDTPNPRGRDFDLNEIRSELKGLDNTLKQPTKDNIKVEPVSIKEEVKTPFKQEKTPEKVTEDIYEFKEPEPFEFEARKSEEKKKRLPTHRIFDDIPQLKLSPSPNASPDKPLIQEPEKVSKPHYEPSFDKLCHTESFSVDDSNSREKEGESLSLFSEIGGEDSADRLMMSEAEDSEEPLFTYQQPELFPDKSFIPIFKNFTPAKTQETYSKKDAANKLREIEDEFTNSPIKGEQSSDEDPIDAAIQRVNAHPMSDDSNDGDLLIKTPSTPIASSGGLLSTFRTDIVEVSDMEKMTIEKTEIIIDNKLDSVLKLKSESSTIITPKIEIETKEQPLIEENVPKPVSSIEIVETIDLKKETDTTATFADLIIPEPPPGFLIHKEGPSIAEKVLRAINHAKKTAGFKEPKIAKSDMSKMVKSLSPKRDSKSPEPTETPFVETEKIVEPESSTPKTSVFKLDVKFELQKKESPITTVTEIMSKIEPVKSENSLIIPVKKEIVERRKSTAEQTLGGKSNKVLSETIQKLSSQISQPTPTLPLSEYQTDDRSDSTDSDDSDNRLIIDKLSEEESQSCISENNVSQSITVQTEKSTVPWSTESQSDADCEKLAVAETSAALKEGVSKQLEEDSNISLLLCEETIPGSPTPENISEAVKVNKPRTARSMDISFAPSASINNLDQPPKEHLVHKDILRERERENPRENRDVGMLRNDRDCLGLGNNSADTVLDNTPPITPDSSEGNISPIDNQLSDMENQCDSKNDEENRIPAQSKKSCDIDKSNMLRVGGPNSPGAGVRRGRRLKGLRTSDSEDQISTSLLSNRPTKYNFYSEIDPMLDRAGRIALITSRLAELRKVYHSLKAELAMIDRRRKKLRRKEREAVKAAKAACS